MLNCYELSLSNHGVKINTEITFGTYKHFIWTLNYIAETFLKHQIQFLEPYLERLVNLIRSN